MNATAALPIVSVDVANSVFQLAVADRIGATLPSCQIYRSASSLLGRAHIRRVSARFWN